MSEKMQEATKSKSNLMTFLISLLLLILAVIIFVVGKQFWSEYQSEVGRTNQRIADLSTKLAKITAETQLLSQEQPQIKNAYSLTVAATDCLQLNPTVKVTAIPTVTTANSEAANATSPKANAEPQWKQYLNAFTDQLKSLVKFRRKSNNIADISQVNAEINKANFKQLIDQVRWAMFYKDNVVYQSSIKDAHRLLALAFDPETDTVKQCAATLNELAKVQWN